MKLISLQAQNFGSYKDLKLDFTGKGLTLISGPTGAGKSTIMDSVSWALFGKTAKNGTADEVVKWGSNETTSATIQLDNVTVTRTRNPNDLYYTVHPTRAIMRGKDLKDTQLKLNQLLGITPETFLAAVYMHEFSLTSEFFQTNAKNRRQIMEQLTDLSLATNLQENTSEYAKELKKDVERLNLDIEIYKGELAWKQVECQKQKTKFLAWQKSFDEQVKQLEFETRHFDRIKTATLEKLLKERAAFEEQREQFISNHKKEIDDTQAKALKLIDQQNAALKELERRRESIPAEKCPECGSSKNASAHMLLQRDEHKNEKISTEVFALEGRIHTLQERAQRHKQETNPWTAKIEAKLAEPNIASGKYLAKLTEVNPYDSTDIEQQIIDKREELAKATFAKNTAQGDLNAVRLLQEAVQEFRGRVIFNTVSFLQSKTNSFLEKHFESEFKVQFTIAEADSLDTEVYKDGILCSYTQLSKGQRQMLKLCFGAAIQLAIANYSGVQFNTIFMDEVLTGLDETNKAKAFGLIQELSSQYENIYIIEHNENFKTLFTSRIDVSLENGSSIIHESH